MQGPFSQRVPSILARAIPASYFVIACVAFWNNFLRTGKWTSLFWMVSEGVVVILLVFRKPFTMERLEESLKRCFPRGRQEDREPVGAG